jgi:hypothetical protein
MADWVASINGKVTRLFSSCKRRAKLTQANVTITQDWLREKLNVGVCELTGLPFNFSGRDGHTRQAYAPSVDRINSQNPNYTPENCRLVLWAVNCSMSEYGEEIMLPIFRAILNAKENAAAPVSTRDHIPGAVGAELGSVSTPWTWQDDDHPHHHCGTISREDLDHRAQAGGGDSVGRGGEEVGSPKTPES